MALDRRWSTNIALFGLNMAVQRLLAPVSAIVAANAAIGAGVGVFQWLDTPWIAAVVLGVLALDAWKYAEHRLMHGVPVLWRLHMVHHCDTDVDFTTAERHHPIEVAIGVLGMAGVAYVFAVPPVAIMAYALAAGVVAVFSHANIRLPGPVDAALRWFIVTPVVHGVHHSAERWETDSNFGLMMTLWDRLFGTYTADTAERARRRRIGLEYFRDARSGWIDRILLMPFLRAGGSADEQASAGHGETLEPAEGESQP